MHILTHICCGPCAIFPVARLREQGHQVRGFFYNPNIHPYQEFARRLDTLEQYAEAENLPVIYRRRYSPNEYLREVVYRENRRCQICYYLRLQEAARIARKGKFDAFTTTLLVSPYQKHDLVRAIGEAVGEEHGVPFYYEDFRPGYAESVRRSKALGMYRQPYCGCIYSEGERYCPRELPAEPDDSPEADGGHGKKKRG